MNHHVFSTTSGDCTHTRVFHNHSHNDNHTTPYLVEHISCFLYSDLSPGLQTFRSLDIRSTKNPKPVFTVFSATSASSLSCHNIAIICHLSLIFKHKFNKIIILVILYKDFHYFCKHLVIYFFTIMKSVCSFIFVTL